MLWRILLITAVVILVISGCGGGGGGGGGGSITNPLGPIASGGTISGTIFIDQTVAGMRNDVESSSLQGKTFLDATVFLEEAPSTFGQVDSTGKFTFENLSMGTWHVIARVRSLSGRLYKFRSPALSLTTSQPAQQTNISLSSTDFADYQTKIQVKDLNGNLVGRCRIKLWGELFTMDEAGYYVSPMMPAGAAGLIRIEPPADKELAVIEMQLPADSFQPESTNVLGVSVPTYGITNRPPIVKISVAQNNGKVAFLRLFGNATDPEGEPLEFRWATNVSTFSYITSSYADWAVPSIAASVTIILSASENGRYYPRLTSSTQLNINVASSGAITFPGEILLPPVTRAVTIIGTGTAQMLGNTIAQFEAVPDFPSGLTLSYSWASDQGQAIGTINSRIFYWRSPAIGLTESREVSISLTVSDGIASASHRITVRVTSAPTVVIDQPASSTFEPGQVAFSGQARDFLNREISPDSMAWYIATGTADYGLMVTGSKNFTYTFVNRGSYRVALEAYDSNGVIGTTTREITIINARPVVHIVSPADNSSFRKDDPVQLVGNAIDNEDGLISSTAALSWRSDLDGILGVGSSLQLASLSSGLHQISLAAIDSDGAVGSASIMVWYDVPARITFLPANLSVAFVGTPLQFIASGTDSDGQKLDPMQFKWYRSDLAAVWKTGEKFNSAAGELTAGNYRFWVEGVSSFGVVKSQIHNVEVGWPVASITSPASGTRFDPGASVSFVGTPTGTGTLQLAWFIDGNSSAFGTGPLAAYSPTNGFHMAEYIGTDSFGVKSVSRIDFVVERVPAVTIARPLSGGYYFAGRSITLQGSALDSENSEIADSRLTWLLDGSVNLGTGRTRTLQQPSQLSAGLHSLSLLATGPYGTSGSATISLYSGVQLATVTSPISRSTFNVGDSIVFKGLPAPSGPLVFEWWANYGTAGALKLGTGAEITTSALPEGYHQITYLATDSSGYLSRASINVSVGQFPVMDFTPAADTVFFAGHDVILSGTGFDPVSGQNLPGSRMAWLVDGLDFRSGNSIVTVTPTALAPFGPGLKQIELRGTNFVNAVGTKIKSIYLGLQNATITQPVQDTLIKPDTPFTLSGSPDSTGVVEMQWWANYGLAGQAQLGTGQTITTSLPFGDYYITYIGTDSAGISSSAKIRIIVSDNPSITFTPPDGSRLFTGRPFSLSAVGAHDPTKVKWYKNGAGTVWLTGSPVVVPVGGLNPGDNQVVAEGANILGVPGSITNSIYYGVPLASISVPASGTSWPIGSAIDFAGTPAPVPPIAMQWYRDDGSGAVLMGSGATLDDLVIPPGLQTVTYLGTDSAGFCSSASIQLLVNDPPTMAISPGDNAVFFTGRTVTFTGSGVSVINGQPVAATTMEWFLNGTSARTNSPVSWSNVEQPAGWQTLRVTGRDEYGTSGQSPTINVKFKQQIASITAPASGTRFDIGAPVTLAGLPDSEGLLAMEWRLDNSATPFAVDGNPAAQVFAPGRHTITYLGTDSASFCSSASIMILVNSAPDMEILPGDGSMFFAGRSISLTGSGTASIGTVPVASSNMRWYVDGVFAKTDSPAVWTTAQQTSGWRSVVLEGVDDYATTGQSAATSIKFGHQIASITFPASGTRFDIGDSVSFTGIPDNEGLISMEWHLDGNPAAFGSGSNPPAQMLSPGWHSITYLGTDSANFCSSATINVLVNDAPIMEILPGNNSVFFAGRSVTFTGSGTSVISGASVAPATMKWYIDGAGTPSKTNSPVTWTALEQGLSGWRSLRLEGTDDSGTIGQSPIFAIKFGHPLASITSPASGTRFNVGASVTLTGQPESDALLPMEWYLDGNTTPFATGSNPPAQIFSPGLHTIAYVGTDSANFCSSAAIQILVNNPPALDFAPGADTYLFVGRPVTFVGAGTSTAGLSVGGASMNWYLNDSAAVSKSGSSAVFSVGQLLTGNNKLKLTAVDEYGTPGEITYNYINYGVPMPLITSPATGTRFPIGSQVSFTAQPDEILPAFTTTWYHTAGTGSPRNLGNSASVNNISFQEGLHTIRYVATDSTGFVASSTIQILLDDPPNITFSPVTGSLVFTGKSFSLYGTGTASIPPNPAIDPLTVKWYLDGSSTMWKNTNPVIINVGDLTPGWHDISAVGADSYGVKGTGTQQIYYGHPVASITSPASGTHLPTGSNVSFTGSAASASIEMRWYLNGADTGIVGQNYSAILPNGWNRIEYAGRDGANNVSTGTVMILLSDAPLMDFAPGNGSRFFTGTNVTFIGVGTGSVDSFSIPPANMKWYLDGAGAPSKTGSPVTFTSGELSSGNHILRLEGTDQNGTAGDISYSFSYGHAVADILSPISGTNHAIGTTLTLSGTPGNTGPITMEWWLNYGQAGAVNLGNGNSVTHTFNDRGWQSITYLATDSAGVVNSDLINILINATPTLTITSPANNVNIFGGQSISFSGSGLNSVPALLPASNLNWYRNGAPWKSGLSSFIVTPAEMATNSYQIRLEGIDEFGAIGSVAHSIYFGVDLPAIISPASGARFDTGSSVSFAGNDLNSFFSSEWYWVEGAAIIGNGPTASIATLSRGIQTITYRATDGIGSLRSKTIQILIDKLPTFTTTPRVTSPNKYGDGPLTGLPATSIPIYIASAGTAVSFNVAAVNEIAAPIPAASTTWLENGVPFFIGNSTTLNFENPGSYTYKVIVEDEFEQIATATLTFWIWDSETYVGMNLDSPWGITNSGDTLLFVANYNGSNILKLNRATAGLTTSGDLTFASATLVASCSHPFVDVAMSGGLLYSLGANGLGSIIQNWETGNMNSQNISYLYSPAELDVPLGISLDSSAIYVSDTNNDKVKKLDINNGAFFSQSQSVSRPIGVKHIDSNTLFVAEESANRLAKFKSDLNSVATWNSQTVNGPAHFAYSGGTGNLYVTDPSLKKVHVVASSGALLYSFGVNGSMHHQGQFLSPYGIVIVGNDIYVTDQSANSIVRFRTNSW